MTARLPPLPKRIEKIREILATMTSAERAIAVTIDPFMCRSCGREVEPARRCYAVPTCFACLPPPPPLPVRKVLR